MLVTLVATKENCFHEPFKTIKTVRISKFNRQRVPDCQAGIVEHWTSVHAESTARHSETVCKKGVYMLPMTVGLCQVPLNWSTYLTSCQDLSERMASTRGGYVYLKVIIFIYCVVVVVVVVHHLILYHIVTLSELVGDEVDKICCYSWLIP